MLPKPMAVCTGGRGQAPPLLLSGCQRCRQSHVSRKSGPGSPVALGAHRSPSPSLQAPFLLARVTLWMPVFTTMFRPMQMASGQFLQLRNWSFWSPFPPTLPPVHPSLLLACFPAHHPKEKSLGLVQQGPLSPLTSGVCWHCNWWSSP